MSNYNTPVNSFSKGNQNYKLATITGRHRLFAEPQDLLNAAYCYFDWVENHPLIDHKYVGGEAIPLRKMRAMSLQGLSVYLGICNLRYYNKHADFSPIVDYIKDAIFAHNYAGAAAGLLKECIIARSMSMRQNR